MRCFKHHDSYSSPATMICLRDREKRYRDRVLDAEHNVTGPCATSGSEKIGDVEVFQHRHRSIIID